MLILMTISIGFIFKTNSLGTWVKPKKLIRVLGLKKIHTYHIPYDI
jgi:hypothetical protein